MTTTPPPHVCATCGQLFTGTTDDRIRHRTLFGHTPSRTIAPTQVRGTTSHRCHRGRHIECGGGVVIERGFTGVCVCWCHGTEGAS